MLIRRVALCSLLFLLSHQALACLAPFTHEMAGPPIMAPMASRAESYRKETTPQPVQKFCEARCITLSGPLAMVRYSSPDVGLAARVDFGSYPLEPWALPARGGSLPMPHGFVKIYLLTRSLLI